MSLGAEGLEGLEGFRDTKHIRLDYKKGRSKALAAREKSRSARYK